MRGETLTIARHEACKPKTVILTAFALQKSSRSINIRLIGPVRLKASLERVSHFRGIVSIDGKTVPVFDDLVLAGFEPREITGQSCVVLLGSNDGLNGFRSAIIVDNVVEILTLARKTCLRHHYAIL